jgi:hypothetical protein
MSGSDSTCQLAFWQWLFLHLCFPVMNFFVVQGKLVEFGGQTQGLKEDLTVYEPSAWSTSVL